MSRALLLIAGTVREFLLPHWLRWHDQWGPPAPACASQWTCVRSSLFLARALNKCGLDASFESGRPSSDGDHADVGVMTAEGWVSHAWVVIGNSLIDITADQFGAEPIIVTSISDPAYRRGDRTGTRLTPTSAGLSAVENLWQIWDQSSERERLRLSSTG